MIDFGAAPLGVLELIKERKGGDSKGYFLRLFYSAAVDAAAWAAAWAKSLPVEA